MKPQTDVFEPVARLLEAKTAVPSLFGAKHLSDNAKPPRYVWVPTSGDVRDPREIGGGPRHLHDVWISFEVHVWGPDFDQTWQLVRNLTTALRHAEIENIRSYEIGSIDLTPVLAKNPQGWVFVVPLSIAVPLEEVDFDEEAGFVVIEEVEIDTSQGVDPDGLLTTSPAK